MSFIKDGIQIPSNKNLPKTEKSTLSPKELWEKKEKAYRLKFVLLFILSHILWLLGSLESDSDQSMPVEVSVEKGFTIVQLPAWNYGAQPKDGQKIKVSLFGPVKSQFINGHLRALVDDPLGPTGSKAILEVPQSSLSLIKKESGPWTIYPPLEASHQNTQTRSPYEISW
jgi:hypothetical protein